MNNRATMILIDNSPTTINEDFIPNRLLAQTICAQRLAQNFSIASPNSQVGVITLSRPEFGIRSSLTPNPTFINNSMQNVKRGKQPIDILHGVKVSVLALKNGLPTPSEKRILILISSDSTIDDEIANNIVKIADDNNIIIDVVVIGSHVQNVETLRKINGNNPKSVFLHIKSCPTIVADFVLATSIGLKKSEFPSINAKLQRTDPELYNALKESKHKDNPEWFSSEFTNVMDPKVKKSQAAKQSPSKETKKKKTNAKHKDTTKDNKNP